MGFFTIITINTWKCDGEYDKRIPLLAKQLANLKPDIIACQECFQCYESNTDTLKYLSEELNMHSCFLPGREKKRLFNQKWVDSVSGLGILSSLPIISTKHFALPSAPEDDDRKVQQVSVKLPTGYLLLTNTHLTHLPNPELKKEQTEFIGELLNRDKSSRYRILCGDFNAQIDSKTIESLKKLIGAIDCYSAGGGAEPRYSLSDLYYKSEMICVDHIFAMPVRGTNKYPEFVNSEIVLNKPDELTGLFPSDHFGIITTMIVE